MIQYKIGNIFDSETEAIVNTVNTDGVMGKGIALQFKNLFPYNFKEYYKACKSGLVYIGKLLVVHDTSLIYGNKIIINFPTKTSWRNPSEYRFIENGLIDLKNIIENLNIKSIALPPLGSGNGGLDWNKVKELINKHLEGVDCDIIIFEPSTQIIDVLKKERVPLTPARAMLLAVLYDLVRNGEFVSEFASEKVAYFLQKFGAKEIFKLKFEPNFYGPYSGKVKHVLYYLNGSYLMGYNSKDAKPFEELNLIMDAELDVIQYLNSHSDKSLIEITNKTKLFLSGFYSNFALELLSTVDFIAEKASSLDEKVIEKGIENWSNRKKNLFANSNLIPKAISHLNEIK
jgi:O-acetyl-ADP-ribose deacetylase (regulator of RNase III)